MFPKLRFILLHNIIDIIVFFVAWGNIYIAKSIGTSNVHILPFFLQIQQCNQF